MRLIHLAWIIWSLLAGIAQAEIACSIVDQPIDLGAIEARDQNARFSTALELVCRNSDNEADTALVVLVIDYSSPDSALAAPAVARRIPLSIRNGHGTPAMPEPGTICVPVTLNGGAMRSYRLPIDIVLRLRNATGARYSAAVPYRYTVWQDGTDARCDRSLR